MRWTNLSLAHAQRHFDRHLILWMVLGYPVLYALGYLSKSATGSAPIWPAHALTFAAFMLLPVRLWPLVAIGGLSWELLSRPLLYWATTRSQTSLALTCSFAFANILTTAGPAALARLMRLFRRQERFQLVISPLWIVALFAGVLPGALLGAAASANAAGMPLVPSDTGLWVLASVLSIVTFG